MTVDWAERLTDCAELIGYTFRDPGLLRRALTHSSNKMSEADSNERLEFLGDAILGLVICEHLFQQYPGLSEGRLTRIKSVVVSQRTLAHRTRRLGLDRHLSLGKGLAAMKRIPASILADSLEALIAAVYLDSDLNQARAFVLRHLDQEIERVIRNEHRRNYKSLLQQLVQKKIGHAPSYRLLQQSGPDHSKEFQVVAVVQGQPYESGLGATKKEAEQNAAEATYYRLLKELGATEEELAD